ncbi:hypothetical protein S40288_08109 [Stachybotrys chartarum IBT 40288]|nr:hypothetical protein S40288_08109 [Stachybotrys chartarum IBT 40288]
MTLKPEEQSAAVHERRNSCSGWHCLTEAQKFGVIFSIVTTSIILTLAWTYYLGRVLAARRQSTLFQSPGGRRSGRRTHGSSNLVLGELPVAIHGPGYHPRVIYQPVIYNLIGPQVLHAQPCAIAEPRISQPVTVPWQPIYQQANYVSPVPGPAVGVHRGGDERSREQSRTPRGGGWRPRRPSLRQRLDQILRIPLGTASTIASSSASEAERRLSSQTMRNTISNQFEVLPKQLQASTTPAPSSNSDRESEDDGSVRTGETVEEAEDGVSSLHTNAATVHSDDFNDGPRITTSSAATSPPQDASWVPLARGAL